MRMGRLRPSSTTQQCKAQDELVQLEHSCLLASLLSQEAALLPLAQALLAGLLPSRFPLIRTHGGAQRQHRIDMRALPAHASPFETCLDDSVVGAFNAATTKGPAHRLIAGILHVRLPLAQVGDLLVEISDVGMAVQQPSHFLQDRCWSLVLELMQLLPQPLLGQRAASRPQELSNVTEIVCRMGTRRECAPHQADADPQSAFLHSAPSCTAHTSSARPTPRRSVSTVAKRPKVSLVGQTGKIREVDDLDALLWSLLAGFLVALDLSNHDRFGFGSHSPYQRHHGSIVTSEQFALGLCDWFGGWLA